MVQMKIILNVHILPKLATCWVIRLRNEPGIKRYVFGPGGGGAGSKDYDAQEAVKQPGFSFQWGGAAIDKNDNIFLARLNPTSEIQVFDPKGKFLRKLALKDNLQPYSMRFGIDGALWLGCVNNLLRIDPLTGNEEKNIANVSARTVHIGPDGTIYLFGDSRVWRFTPTGEVLPFTTTGTTVKEKGRYLNLNPRDNNVPAGTAGYALDISSVIGHADGSFEILTAWMDDPRNGKRAVLRFAADGTYQPHTPAITVLPQQTGNVFLDSEPANLAIQYCNLASQVTTVAVATTVTNLAEEIVSTNQNENSLPALTITTALHPLDPIVTQGLQPPDTRNYFGYYTIDVKATTGQLSLTNERLFGGRVTDRDNIFNPYSPFGSVRMDANPELLRRIGGGLNRGHSAVYWDEVEPKPGEWLFYPADSLTYLRERALPTMSILGYGEPWDNGGFPRCRITSYDTFWQYCSQVISHYKGTPMMWQFWNEPNYFWHVPGAYRYEQYAMALKGVYAIAKAIDPNTKLICDGFAGEAQGMKQLGEWGCR